MAIKLGYMPYEGYTKIDNQVARIKELSGNAVKMYVFIAGLQNGRSITDQYLVKALGFSKKSITKYKNELKAYDLLAVERVHRGLHYMYVGSTSVSASALKEYAVLNEDNIKTLSLDDVRRNQLSLVDY